MERYRKENDAGEDDKGMKGRREKEGKRREKWATEKEEGK